MSTTTAITGAQAAVEITEMILIAGVFALFLFGFYKLMVNM